MERALALAVKAKGKTSPNPMVGAVIVKSGKVVAEGYHREAGGDHAEVSAIKKARGESKGAAIYVNLEPCCHTGKTGPCTEAIIKAGIKKVVIATRDPNPLVSGKGVAILKKAGITVLEGLLQKEAKELNKPFEKFITQKLPYVILKAACSLDGKIAATTGESKWITNDLCRKRVHEMREECDAVMVGINTLLTDDPSLNVRPAKKGTTHPARVIIDTKLKTSPQAKVFHSAGGDVYIMTGQEAPEARARVLEKSGGKVIRVAAKGGRVSMKGVMKELAKLGMVSILLEGGSELFTDALDSGLVDRIALFYAPIIIGGTEKYTILQRKRKTDLTDSIKLKGVKRTDYGDNFLIEGEVEK
jgi:diaminohydroxyphosphoribosylaminopyrimidine deaminase/5-amino-6-(5-phosphoribosylamino)uracil reductase